MAFCKCMKNILTTLLFHILKVNEDWACQALKLYKKKSTIKVICTIFQSISHKKLSYGI